MWVYTEAQSFLYRNLIPYAIGDVQRYRKDGLDQTQPNSARKAPGCDTVPLWRSFKSKTSLVLAAVCCGAWEMPPTHSA
ncbi:uncharacterized [Tachysurus ichikawai]